MESKLRQDDDALWRRFAESRDPAIREELVRRNMPFAKRLALRYRGASESFDDLLQVANLGLLGAIDRFDPERGIPFTALASALPSLDERERLVLRLRFAEDMTQSQIADRIGHSQMHVSRILRRALARIREQIREQQQSE